MYDIIFTLNGVEKLRYDYENEADGERQATCELIAFENNCNIEDIKIYKQKRITFNITLYRSFSEYGRYEDLDYNNTFSVLKECLSVGNNATIKTSDKRIFNISNSETFRYFVEEFGAYEI